MKRSGPVPWLVTPFGTFRPEKTWTFHFGHKNIDVSAKKMDDSAKICLIVLQNRILFVGGIVDTLLKITEAEQLLLHIELCTPHAEY